MKKDITELYSFIDDFCKIYSEYEKQKLLPSLKQRNRGHKMSLDEQLTVVIMYHSSYAKNFKYFYKTTSYYFSCNIRIISIFYRFSYTNFINFFQFTPFIISNKNKPFIICSLI